MKGEADDAAHPEILSNGNPDSSVILPGLMSEYRHRFTNVLQYG